MPQTTVSILTPPGAGAIGVIRLQGPDAVRVAAQVFQSKTGCPSEGNEDGRLRFGRIVDGEETLDEGIACVSSSGDAPIVDLCVHGGTRILERALGAAEKQGAIPCSLQAGAVWSASNLIELEALEALVSVKTSRAVRFLISQRMTLPEAIRSLASPNVSIHFIQDELGRMIEAYSGARRMIEGVTIVIVGPTNSGKSTLFNRLVGRSSAIVSDIEGTTRDWVSGDAEIDGVAVTFIDTAGRRSTGDLLEDLAIAKGAEAAGRADIVISMLDGSRPIPTNVLSIDANVDGARILHIASKSDLAPGWNPEELAARGPAGKGKFMRISANTGDGMDELIARLADEINCHSEVDQQPVLFTERQAVGARKILDAVDKSDGRLVHGQIMELLGV